MQIEHTCPNCGTAGMSTFYELGGVPAHSVLLLPTRSEALSYPTGDIQLRFCATCDFIANLAFDPALNEYSARYEETQGYSETFNAFSRSLALRLIERHNLRGKNVVEIGCGKGEFLTLLCEQGGNHGVGFDPSYVGDRSRAQASERVTFIKDFYSEQYAGYQADFICCKMTLEHIHCTADFVGMVRRSIGARRDTVVFFQVPDATRVLRDMAFWDIYYEHCSYFGPRSLAYVFQQQGFEILDLWRDYDDQYLMIEARPSSGAQAAASNFTDLPTLEADVRQFATGHKKRLDWWRSYLQHIRFHDRRVVLWGGGSKAVAFLTTLGIHDEIEYAVDINPHKQGTFLAGTGQRIVAPEFLQKYRPHVVIIMNPIYEGEIRRYLDTIALDAEIVPICEA